MKSKTIDIFEMAILVIGAMFLIFAYAPAFATGTRTPEQRQDQNQDQNQDQSQDQSQDQYQSAEQANSQSATVNNTSDTKVYAAGASSGDSTSTCMKVRDLRLADSFLFGIRWDLKDNDCERLNRADKAYDRGDTYFADTLYCSTPVILSAFESVDDCKTQLERNDVVTALEERIKVLEAQKASALAERAADNTACEEAKDRIAESKACVGK